MTLQAFCRDPRAVLLCGSGYHHGNHSAHREFALKFQEDLRSSNEMNDVIQPRGFTSAAQVVLYVLFFFLPSSGESSHILGYERDRTYRTGGGILTIFRDELISNILILLFRPT